jgi:hypothetical protein
MIEGLRVPAPEAPPPPLDPPTLAYVVQLLTQRLDAVVAFGAGGCPTCHDAELRGVIAKLKELAPHAAK